MVFREENPLPNTPLPQLIPWGLLRAIAIIQLYIEERFIEPPRVRQLPFSLLFQQTLSILGASGELTPKRLADRVLSLPPFAAVSREDYRTLIISMLENEFLELTEEKGLIVGTEGERLLGSFKFYAVFKDTEDYTVRCGSDEIGVITSPPPVGDRFALAGRVWEVEELDLRRRLIYVRGVEGKMEISWPGDFGEITRIIERMKQVPPRQSISLPQPNAAERQGGASSGAQHRNARALAGLPRGIPVPFPGSGPAFRTLRKFLLQNSRGFKVSNLDFEGCYYMTFRMERGDDRELIRHLAGIAAHKGIDCASLVSATELPVFDKYDDYIPGELLRKAYAADKLRADEVERRLQEIAGEYE